MTPEQVSYADRIAASAIHDGVPLRLSPTQAHALATRYGARIELDQPSTLRSVAALIATALLTNREGNHA